MVFFPANCQLLDLWKTHMLAIHSLFAQGDDAAEATRRSDQTSLSTAIEFLRRDLPFKRLPVEFHTHYLHLFRRSPSLADAKLYHAIGFLKRIGPKFGPLQRGVALYRRYLLWKLLREWQLDCRYRRQVSNPWRTLIPACRDALQLTTRMNAACDRYIPPEHQS